MKQNKNIIFTPGWMYSPGYFKLGKGLDFWKREINIRKIGEYDFFIGHSMGAVIAMKLWSLHKEKKVILINPFLEQRNVLKSMANWARHIQKEGLHKDSRLGLKYFANNFKKVLDFSKEDHWSFLKDIPREKITILHGKNDSFLCGKKTLFKLKRLGFKIIEIPDAGHNWHQNFDKEIEKIIQ